MVETVVVVFFLFFSLSVFLFSFLNHSFKEGGGGVEGLWGGGRVIILQVLIKV